MTHAGGDSPRCTVDFVAQFPGEGDACDDAGHARHTHGPEIEEAARASFFGRLVASGWQTLGVTMRLMVEARPLGTTPLIGLQIDDIRFTRPVLPGDTLSAELEILEKRVSKTAPSRGFVKGRTITSNQKGAEVSSQLWTMMVPLRNPGSLAG